MLRQLIRNFDWPQFWLQEVVIISAPLLIMVMTATHEPALSNIKLTVLLVLISAMTAFNVFLVRFGFRRR